MLPLVDTSSFKTAVGSVLALLCPVMLFSKRLPTIRRASRLADSGIGLVGGFMSVDAPSPPNLFNVLVRLDLSGRVVQEQIGR